MIRVIVAEDQAMVRGAIVALLTVSAEDIEVVGQAENGRHAVEICQSLRPDVALMDIEMPEMDGLTAAQILHTELPATRVIILTTFARPGFLRRAFNAGASGYLLKDAPADQLALAVRRVVAGERVVQPELATEALVSGDGPLTAREREALKLSDGRSVSAIAEILHLTEGTVRNYLSEAIQKLGAANRIEARRIAEEKGWL